LQSLIRQQNNIEQDRKKQAALKRELQDESSKLAALEKDLKLFDSKIEVRTASSRARRVLIGYGSNWIDKSNWPDNGRIPAINSRRICESRRKSRRGTSLHSQYSRYTARVVSLIDACCRYQAKNVQRADEKEQIDIQQQEKRRLEEEINQASAELRRGAEELRNEYRKVLHDFCE
jgi:hypothetical protein